MIGLGTYAFFWQHSNRAPQPLALGQMLDRTRELGGDVFQICDYGPLADLGGAALREVRSQAAALGLTLELGTRGASPENLRRYLELARVLDARVVRAILFSADYRTTIDEVRQILRTVMPEFVAADVRLALETYEQLGSRELVRLIEDVGSSHLGICLDPANCVAALEHPREVVERCAPYVFDLHVKDFAFTRRGGWVGFTLEGAELGTGLLDYAHLLATVRPAERGIARIVEHWIPWQVDYAETARIENLWNERNLAFMRRHDAGN